MDRIFQSGWVVGALAVVIAGLSAVAGAAAQTTPPYLGSFPNFEAQLTPQQLPGDVDVALEQRLEGEQKFPEVQRLFDLWSWQAFISLNWPTDPSGKRTRDATQPPAWSLWTGSTHVFLPHGAPPPVCKTGTELAAASTANLEVTLARGYAPTRLPEQLDSRRVRLLAVTSAVNGVSSVAAPPGRSGSSASWVSATGFGGLSSRSTRNPLAQPCCTIFHELDRRLELADLHPIIGPSA